MSRSTKEYFIVYIALMILLGLTFWTAYLDLGRWNGTVNLGIATFKATLVFLFFMHVASAKSLTRIFAISGVLWLFILFSLVLSDYMSRSWMNLPGHWPQPSSKLTK